MVARFDRRLLPPRPDLSFELDLWGQGIEQIAGIDEAGRGALAGPVSAAAVIFPPDPALYERLDGVRDSKQMAPEAREIWAAEVRAAALAWGVGFAANEEIDRLGIVPATCLAASRALRALRLPPQHLLVDFLALPDCQLPQSALVKGDARCLSIAAASVLAKTARDAVLRELEGQYPGYGFAAHKGYATAAHYGALERLGPCAIHRLSFRLARQEPSA